MTNTKYTLKSFIKYSNLSLTNPFWVANLRIDGARAIEEAAAAAATRILQHKTHDNIQILIYSSFTQLRRLSFESYIFFNLHYFL